MKRNKKILLFVKYIYAPLALYCINVLINKLIPIVRIFSLSKFIDSLGLLTQSNKFGLIVNLGMLIVLFLGEYITNSLNEFFIEKIRLDLMSKFYPSLLSKCYCLDYELNDNETGWNIINRIKNKPIDNIVNGYINLISFISIVIEVLCFLLIVSKYEWYLCIIIIFVSVPSILFSIRNGNREYECTKKVTKYKRLSDYWNSINTEKEFLNERKIYKFDNYVNQVWKKYFYKYTQNERSVALHAMIDMKIVTIIMIFSVAFTAFILLKKLIIGSMTPGIYISIIQAYISLIDLLGWDLADCIKGMSKFFSFRKDYICFTDMKENDINNNYCNSMDKIEIRNLSYKYPNQEKYVLQNINLVFEKNNKYAIVGVNGSGKTTLINIIVGLYNNYTGEILINGKDKKEIKNLNFNNVISMLPQEYGKYGISIKNNIFLGREEELNSTFNNKLDYLLNKVGLLDIVNSLENKSNTELLKFDKTNFDFSGGQWQRLAMARMLAQNSQIQILDEPTASMDPLSEREIYNKYAEVNDKTTIFITHRLGSINNVDKIIVLDQGMIVEEGTHKELMEKKGLYRKMYDSQKEWYK